MNDIIKGATDFLVKYGYLPAHHKVESFDDIDFTAAVAKFQRMDANIQNLAEQAGADPIIPDGRIGGYTAAAMALPRCGHADDDILQPAIGTGGWKNCHGASDHHKAIVLVDPKNNPHDAATFRSILSRVQRAYAKIGMLFVFCQKTGNGMRDLLTNKTISGNVNIEFSFQIGSGWIGLAIVGNGHNQMCSAKIWCRYHYPYRPSNIVREWTTLVKHELGHNCGLRHTRGGVMNPSLVNGLAADWVDSDPSTGLLKRWFSGVPIPLDGDGDNPPGDDGDTPGIGQPLSDPFKMHDGTVGRIFRQFGG
ncbi:MAG: hypothetical protein ACPGPS_04060 [Rubripirellula sp.]